MARVDVRINADVRDAVARLNRFVRDIEPRKMLRLVGLRKLKWIADNFRAEGLERKWKPLTASTVAARRKNSSKILQDTGRLRQSFEILRVTSRQVQIGSRDPRAVWHHEGTKPYVITPKRARLLSFTGPDGNRVFARRVNHPGLPARPLIASQATTTRIAVEVIDSVTNKAARRA